jgi:hypothetical protein
MTASLDLFDPGAFIDYLTSAGLRWSTADLYARYVRPTVNRGVDPVDHAGFESYVRGLSTPTQSVRRTAWRWWQRYKGLPLQPEAPAQDDDGTVRVDSPFVRFGEWLPRVRGLAPSSVHVYVATVKRCVDKIGPNPTREALDAFLKDQGTSYRARFSTIWRRWEEYHREIGKTAADFGSEPARGIPDDVCFALHYCAITVGIQLAHLRALTWADLHEPTEGNGFDVRYLPDPQPGRYYKQRLDDAAVINALRAWSLPFDTTAFVAPGTRGGTAQLSRQEIQAAVNRGALLAQNGHVLSDRRAVAVPMGERPSLGAPWGMEIDEDGKAVS